MSSEADEWKRLDSAIRYRSSTSEIETMLENRSAHFFVNRLMPEDDFNRVAHTLLYTAVFQGRSEIVALLLWYGADPLQTAVIYRGKNAQYATNAMEVCVVHLHAQPTSGVFLLRLLDSRPVDGAKGEDLVNQIGRDVDAPLVLLTHGGEERLTVNALEWACQNQMVHCVRWLLYRRNADPSAVHGGFDALMRHLDTHSQINDMLMEWRDRRLAVGMAAHARLGRASALRTLGPDAMRLVLAQQPPQGAHCI